MQKFAKRMKFDVISNRQFTSRIIIFEVQTILSLYGYFKENKMFIDDAHDITQNFDLSFFVHTYRILDTRFLNYLVNHLLNYSVSKYLDIQN